jgi:hypothetical protein
MIYSMLNENFPKIKRIQEIFVINNLVCKLNIHSSLTSKKFMMQEFPFAGLTNPNSFSICRIDPSGTHLLRFYLELYVSNCV